MRIIIQYVFLLISCTGLFGQSISITVDTINQTKIYKQPDLISYMETEINPYELIIIDSIGDNIAKIKGFRGQKGYIKESDVVNIDSLNDFEKWELFDRAIKLLLNHKAELSNIKFGIWPGAVNEKNKEIEQFVHSEFAPLLDNLVSYICEKEDSTLMTFLLWTECITKDYEIWETRNALVDCYICKPQFVMDVIDNFIHKVLEGDVRELMGNCLLNYQPDETNKKEYEKLKKKYFKWNKDWEFDWSLIPIMPDI